MKAGNTASLTVQGVPAGADTVCTKPFTSDICVTTPPQLTLIGKPIDDGTPGVSTTFSMLNVPLLFPGGTVWQAGNGAVSVVEDWRPPLPVQESKRLKLLPLCGPENAPVTKLAPAVSVVGPKESITNPGVLGITARVQLAGPVRVTEARNE